MDTKLAKGGYSRAFDAGTTRFVLSTLTLGISERQPCFEHELSPNWYRYDEKLDLERGQLERWHGGEESCLVENRKM